MRMLEDVDIVYHLASVHLDVSVPDDEYRDVNVRATEDLLRAAKAAGVRRVVHCSSVGVLGRIIELPADETTPCNPTNIYERSKLEGERRALRVGGETGLSVVVARPAWVYGPRSPRTAKLFRTISKGRFVLFGSGQTLRHPIYVSDSVYGLELCAAGSGIEGQIYILAGESPVTIDSLVRIVADLVGVRPPSVRLPIFLAILAGTALQAAFRPLGRQPPFSRRSVDFFDKDNAYDIGKAQRELKFQPRVNLQEGLSRTLEWLKRQSSN